MKLIQTVTTRSASGVLAAVTLGLTAMPAFAAAAPQPSLTRAPSPLLGFGLMFLMALAVISISFIPSKRGHQD